jgi:hypothetical protein
MESPEGYDFSSGKKLLLFGKLEEISGIAFLPDSDTILMAVNDEEGRVYEVNINNPKFKADPFEFAGKGDYEDITFYKGLWQVLHSNGTIYAGDLITPEWPKPPKILPEGEYEGMVAYQDTLFVICKECPENEEGKATVFFIKTAGDSLHIANSIQLDATEFMKGKQKKVLASALARHPFTHEWYILSHLNGSLYIADSEFKIKQSVKLPRSLFSQPEGIAFSSTGDLFISNEGDGASGYILQFEYRD